MKQSEVILVVSQRDSPGVVSDFLASSDFKDKIKVRRVFTSFWVSWYLFFGKISFGEFSQVGDRVEDVSIFVINTDVIIDGVVTGFLWSAWEESELSFKGTERFFAAEFSLFIGEGEISEQKNITDCQGSGVVFDVFREQENSDLLVFETFVDDFESHAVVFFNIFAVGVGRVGDNTQGGELSVGGSLSLDFLEIVDD